MGLCLGETPTIQFLGESRLQMGFVVCAPTLNRGTESAAFSGPPQLSSPDRHLKHFLLLRETDTSGKFLPAHLGEGPSYHQKVVCQVGTQVPLRAAVIRLHMGSRLLDQGAQCWGGGGVEI